MAEHDGAAQILALLDHAPQDCAQLAETLGLTVTEVMRIAAPLWERKLLQGAVSDGCCQDPCGASCIVARRADQRWRLSRKGQSTLRHSREGSAPAFSIGRP